MDVKKTIPPAEISKKLPLKTNFLPLKKKHKNLESGCGKKKVGMKKVKRAPESWREKPKVPVKNPKSPNGFRA